VSGQPRPKGVMVAALGCDLRMARAWRQVAGGILLGPTTCMRRGRSPARRHRRFSAGDFLQLVISASHCAGRASIAHGGRDLSDRQGAFGVSGSDRRNVMKRIYHPMWRS
jgi:hypothetical protein